MKKRKNFLPTFLSTILFWLCFIYILFFTTPESNWLIITFYFFLFLSLFFTLSLLFANSRRGFLSSLMLLGILLLQEAKLLNVLNFILLAGIIITLELYFLRR